jgi:hypothetical protein
MKELQTIEPGAPGHQPVDGFFTIRAFDTSLGNDAAMLGSDPTQWNNLQTYLSQDFGQTALPDLSALSIVLSQASPVKHTPADPHFVAMDNTTRLVPASELTTTDFEKRTVTKEAILTAGRAILALQVSDFSGSLTADLAWNVITGQHKDVRRHSAPKQFFRALGLAAKKVVGGSLANDCHADQAKHIGRLFPSALYIRCR